MKLPSASRRRLVRNWTCLLLFSALATTNLHCHAFQTAPTTRRVPTLQKVEQRLVPSAHRDSYRGKTNGGRCRCCSSRSNIPRYMLPPGFAAVPFSLPYGAIALTKTEHSYYLTRIVLLRALAFVYSIAFLVAKHQNKALIGDHGITPARHVLDAAQERGRITAQRRREWLNSTSSQITTTTRPPSTSNSWMNNIIPPWLSLQLRHLRMKLIRNLTFQQWREVLWDRADGMGRPLTTLLWLAPDRDTNLNPWLDGIATTGLTLSLAVLMLGAANVPLLLGMWLCQRSLMAVGGPWYGFGWEPQLAELGFHAIFLVPWLNLHPIPLNGVPPSPLVLYTIRWHLLRIMMGAGLIKLRSDDRKWKFNDLSAMDYFYETQPVPNPLTRYFHWMPRWWHRGEVVANHFVELIAPWFLLAPVRSLRVAGGWLQIVFQGILILSGNLSFLNWLTAVPAIACLDDAALGGLFREPWRYRAAVATFLTNSKGGGAGPLRTLVSLAFFLLIAKLSVPVVKNLLSKDQVMNASFDPLRLVNTYGAFGSVTEQRDEFIISAAADLDGDWREYEFKVKPGDIMRPPRFISPYHYRLDWLMWIASTVGSLQRSTSWLYPFLFKLLEQDPDVLHLLAKDPFEGESQGPKYIRVDKYRYTFHKRSTTNGKTTPGAQKSSSPQPYWDRERIGRVFPRQGVASKETLREFL